MIVQLAVTSEVLRSCPKFVFAKTREWFGVGAAPYRSKVWRHILGGQWPASDK